MHRTPIHALAALAEALPRKLMLAELIRSGLTLRQARLAASIGISFADQAVRQVVESEPMDPATAAAVADYVLSPAWLKDGPGWKLTTDVTGNA